MKKIKEQLEKFGAEYAISLGDVYQKGDNYVCHFIAKSDNDEQEAFFEITREEFNENKDFFSSQEPIVRQ